MMRMIWAVLLLAVAMPALAGETPKLASTYDEVGTTPYGSTYTGIATVEMISDTTFSIQLTIGSTTYSGFGIRMNDMAAATYMVDGQPGLIVYKVGEDGTLNGLWSIRGQNGNGTDRLTPRH